MPKVIASVIGMDSAISTAPIATPENRSMRCLMLLRPADANETVEAWKIAVAHTDGPVGLVFTRQKLPTLDRSTLASPAGRQKELMSLPTVCRSAQAHPHRYRFQSVDRARGAQSTDW